MSRNNLFLLIACAIVATVMSSNPSPLSRSSLTIASLIASPTDTAYLDPALFRRSLDQQ